MPMQEPATEESSRGNQPPSVERISGQATGPGELPNSKDETESRSGETTGPGEAATSGTSITPSSIGSSSDQTSSSRPSAPQGESKQPEDLNDGPQSRRTRSKATAPELSFSIWNLSLKVSI